MSTIFPKLTGSEFDAMVDRGAFDCIEGKKVELIRGELRFMNPAGPIHGRSYRLPHAMVAQFGDADNSQYSSPMWFRVR
jgi:hypothetical protein